ncbi:DUF2806 domain-containing protein [Paraglaciecola sp. Hal342]
MEDGKNERLDPDWFYNFVNMAEEIHSPAMQELWGKIFAVETNRPGSFSLRTLLILKQLTHKDAQTFRRAVSLSSRRKGDTTPKNTDRVLSATFDASRFSPSKRAAT